jgi:hypothetical protein
VQAYLGQEFDGETLSERAQFRIMRLIANAVLAQQVSQRAYYVHGQSALLRMPSGMGGGES